MYTISGEKKKNMNRQWKMIAFKDDYLLTFYFMDNQVNIFCLIIFFSTHSFEFSESSCASEYNPMINF